MSTEDTNESHSGGLAVNRSRRPKKDKYGRNAALQRLKDAKNTGTRVKYEVADIENVYDTVDEKEYARRVEERLEDDWIVEDGSEYVEDGKEIFDDEFDNGKGQKESSKAKKKVTTSINNKKKVRVVKSSDIKNLLMASAGRKKTVKNVDLSKDELLGDILSEMNNSPSSNLSSPLAPAIIKKKKKLNVGSSGISPSSYQPLPSPKATPPRASVLSRKKTLQPRKIMTPTPSRADDEMEVDDLPPAKRTKVEHLPVAKEATVVAAEQNDGFEDFPDFDEADFDDAAFDEEFTKPEVEKKEVEKVAKPPTKKSSNFMEKLSSLGWETNKSGGTNDEKVNVEVNIDSSSLPTVKNEQGEQVFRFYWLDAHENAFKKPGVVNLFGKVWVESARSHVSCCVTVKNIQRTIHLLPREKNSKTGEEVSPQDVYDEFNTEVADRNKIMKFKTKIVEKENVFGGADIPHSCEYLEISYPAEYGQLSTELEGATFSRVFGANKSPLESLLLQRKIKGPCWIDIRQPQLSTTTVSWCKMEVMLTNPIDLTVLEANLSPPPLVVLALSMKTLPNQKNHQNEVVGISGLIHTQFPIDKAAPKPPFQRSFFAITKPSDCIFPFDFRDVVKSKNYQVEMFGTERALLGFFLARLQKIDPDIVIGHNLIDFDIDVLLNRFQSCKVAHWSKIGRLRKFDMPKLVHGKFMERSIASGRLLCDIKISAKELIRCKSYDLSALTEHVLHKQREQLPLDQIKNMYTTSSSLSYLMEHTLVDAKHILDITCELNALPLALQITNIAGNVMSRTLLGGRSERNEFLLLHAFHERGFIPPDKIFKKKETPTTSNKDDSNTTVQGESGRPRKKAAYEGGLVLEPKKGFYDKYILLLDFNSLYPSIIQEYNICFTTLDQYPPEDFTGDKETYIPEVPESGLAAGVLPTEIRKLVDRRREVKKLMKKQGLSHDQYIQYDIRQKALKLTANSMYGCLGFSNSRFYAKPLAALVTRRGREILLHTKELAQNMGLEVIYGDTDSIMINTNSTDMENAFKLGNQVKAEVNKLYKLLEIDIDGVYKSLLLLKKKKYAALSVQKLPNGGYKTEQELKGLDIVRRDWCELAKLAGNYAVNQILSDQPRETIVEKIHDNLQEIGSKVKEGSYPLSNYLIRKELTRDPQLYPGKDNLPHVRVAIRINQSMSKRVKSGDIVSYIVCKDGTSNPATQRSYSEDELNENDKLTIDEEYYLSNQIHPVVTRLCDPIDGTDSALIAQCLGLDPSGFKSTSNTAREDDEEQLMTIQATEEEKYQDCNKFVVTIGGQSVQFDKGVFYETDPAWTCTLAQPFCGGTLGDHLTTIQNQLILTIRSDIRRYYQNWLLCEDPACGHRTRSVPTRCTKYGAACPVCRIATMRPEFPYKALYQQLCYYKLQFDVEYALRKYKQDSNSSKGSLKLDTYRRQYALLYQTVDRFLKRSGYNKVSLPSLFGWMQLGKKQPEVVTA